MPRSKKPKGGRIFKDSLVHVRLTAEHKAQFVEASERLGMDLSTFLRVAAIEKIDRDYLTRGPTPEPK